MKKILLSMVFAMCLVGAFGQNKNFWRSVSKSDVTRDLFANRYKPQSYELFQLNEAAFKSDLTNVPSERNVAVNQSAFIISIPMPNGQVERFRVVEAPVMHADLAARYPNIKAYAGKGIDDPAASIRFDLSPEGFHGTVFSVNHSAVYIDPVDRSSESYVVFYRKDAVNYREAFHCLTEEANQAAQQVISEGGVMRNANDGRLRTYRLALAATGEYSSYHLNGTETSDAERKAKVLAAMNTAMVRTNQVYETDFGIRMVLIANNDAIIYLNAATDPWGTELNSTTQTTIDNVIGSANYDIGHLVTRTTNNGNAGCIGCVCKAGQKGSGWTSHTAPIGDPFVIDYLTHEMGHQFGGNHTYAYRYEGTIAQCEPGSGSTIMGYAGITGATDVQAHSDPLFHARSIEQITNYIKSGTGGGACPVVTITGNSTPAVAGGADFTIPRSTPFTLTGSASDADAGDVLTYIWEQIDARSSSSPTTPSATATVGPVFRSYDVLSVPSRTFPRLSSILDGTNGNQWEVLPSVARTLNFRLTVRDNHAGGGNNNGDDVAITVSSATGPFAVSVPNTAVNWAAGSAQTVTWTVNGTNGAPVNCANVSILLSTDGGQTFPITLVASTPNDGSEVISVPNNQGTQCRVKVAAVGNIFFDISNTNFTISGPALCGDPVGLNATAITNTGATLGWAAVASALSYDVDYKLTSSATWTNAATGTTATAVSVTGLTQGTAYDWRVRANCAAGSGNYVAAQFTTTAPCGTPAGLSTSAITSSSATVSWTALAGASNYTVEYKLTSAATYTTAAAATTATSVNITGLSASSVYNWRVRANCASGPGAYANGTFSTTAVSTCPGPLDVSTNGTTAGAAVIPFNTDVKGLINPAGDLDHYKFTITTGGTATITLTTLPADYDIRLYSSNGTTQLAISQAGSTNSETITRTYTAGTYFIRVYGYQNANNATQCYTLRVALGTASREELITQTDKGKRSVEVFPNPAKNTLNVLVSGYDSRSDIMVFDMYGKLVMQQTASQVNTKLDVSAIPAGVYMVRVRNRNNEISATRFVKQ
jgi:Metallo-peptidase family M12B Reprolysin-like/Secretion system C-terminal sorting domain/Bacterial pre-peptidase C-terminal domain/Fibronectin type III domain